MGDDREKHARNKGKSSMINKENQPGDYKKGSNIFSIRQSPLSDISNGQTGSIKVNEPEWVCGQISNYVEHGYMYHLNSPQSPLNGISSGQSGSINKGERKSLCGQSSSNAQYSYMHHLSSPQTPLSCISGTLSDHFARQTLMRLARHKRKIIMTQKRARRSNHSQMHQENESLCNSHETNESALSNVLTNIGSPSTCTMMTDCMRNYTTPKENGSTSVIMEKNNTVPLTDISNDKYVAARIARQKRRLIMSDEAIGGSTSNTPGDSVSFCHMSAKYNSKKRVIRSTRVLTSVARNIDIGQVSCIQSANNCNGMNAQDPQHDHDEESVEEYDVNTLTGYWDIGDLTSECEFCGAQMWFDERSNKQNKTSKPKFSLCCMQGKVQLPLLQRPPSFLANLLEKKHKRSNHFFENIRAYNMMFSFTSMGGKLETSINQGRGPYNYKIGGQNHHLIGSLLPNEGQCPKFSQLYIYDTEDEIVNRKKAAW